MIALLLCIVAAGAAYFFGRRSLWAGLLGILRANLTPPFSHFIFDAALVAFYASQFLGKKQQPPINSPLKSWVYILMGWPLLMVLMPFQPILVSLVGLRGNMFFLRVRTAFRPYLLMHILMRA